MIRILLGLFVIVHGLITFGIWAAPVTEQAPFNPSHSWLLGDTRTLAVVLAVVAAIAFVVTGGGGRADGALLQPLAVGWNPDQRGDPVRGRPSTRAELSADPTRARRPATPSLALHADDHIEREGRYAGG
jgi:hypothetical protein